MNNKMEIKRTEIIVNVDGIYCARYTAPGFGRTLSRFVGIFVKTL